MLLDILIDLLPSIIKSNKNNQKIIKGERINIVCPQCKSSKVYKNYIIKNNKQRYICRQGNKSFSDNNNSIVYKSKHSYDD